MATDLRNTEVPVLHDTRQFLDNSSDHLGDPREDVAWLNENAQLSQVLFHSADLMSDGVSDDGEDGVHGEREGGGSACRAAAPAHRGGARWRWVRVHGVAR